MIIHNSYLEINPFSVECTCTPYESKNNFSTQEQTTKRIFNSMSELVKEFKAQYSQTLCNRNNIGRPILSIIF